MLETGKVIAFVGSADLGQARVFYERMLGLRMIERNQALPAPPEQRGRPDRRRWARRGPWDGWQGTFIHGGPLVPGAGAGAPAAFPLPG